MAYTRFIDNLLGRIDAVTDADLAEFEGKLEEVSPTDKVLGVASDGLRRLCVAIVKMGNQLGSPLDLSENPSPDLLNSWVTLGILFEASVQKEFSGDNQALGMLLENSILGVITALDGDGDPGSIIRKGWVVVVESAEKVEVIETDLPNLTESLMDPSEQDNEDDDRPDEETRRVTGFSC